MNDNPKRILLVSATLTEIEPLVKNYGTALPVDMPGTIISPENSNTDILITGPGIIATAFHTTQLLSRNEYSLAINAGISGSYPSGFLSLGTVALVSHDRFADMGSESPSGFVTGEKLPFTHLNSSPFNNGWLIPDVPAGFPLPQLPKCRAVTSDTVHTLPESIERIVQNYDPDMETMEGAAFYYVCMNLKIQCLQIRSVSNMVGSPEKANWQFKPAVTNLCDFLSSYLPTL